MVPSLYHAAAWYKDGTTFHQRNNPDPQNPHYTKDYAIRDRYEFVGKLLNSADHISKRYIGKSVKKYLRALKYFFTDLPIYRFEI